MDPDYSSSAGFFLPRIVLLALLFLLDILGGTSGAGGVFIDLLELLR